MAVRPPNSQQLPAGGTPAGPPGSARTPRKARTPAFNIPPVVVTTIVGLVFIHAMTNFGISEHSRFEIYQWFGFVPQRLVIPRWFAGGIWPLLWTPVTYAFLHADWAHVGFNVAWLAVFGSPVARRHGIRGYLLVGAVGSIAGAVGFVIYNLSTFTLMIGASGAISGYTGAAMRFIFQPVETATDPETGNIVVLGRRLAGFRQFLRNRRAISFTGVWLILNVGLGLYTLMTGEHSGIAWQAHVAGFAGGFLAIGWLERRQRR